MIIVTSDAVARVCCPEHVDVDDNSSLTKAKTAVILGVTMTYLFSCELHYKNIDIENEVVISEFSL